jgi:hypothetical protein
MNQPIRPISAPKAVFLTNPSIPIPPVGSGGTNKGMWNGYAPQALWRPTKPPIDRPINILPTGERQPDSAPPQTLAWLNGNMPPWVNPPFWSVPIDLPHTVCMPWYEVDTLLGNTVVPKDRTLVIKNMSYQALNASINDVFTITLYVDGVIAATIEDIYISAAPNPAQRYALAGHFRPMPLNLVVDRNSTLTVRAQLRGPINLAGVSPYFAGQPILSTDCHFKVLLQGWMSNLREDLDGGPRPTDLGDFGMIPLEDDQSRGGFP